MKLEVQDEGKDIRVKVPYKSPHTYRVGPTSYYHVIVRHHMTMNSVPLLNVNNFNSGWYR